MKKSLVLTCLLFVGALSFDLLAQPENTKDAMSSEKMPSIIDVSDLKPSNLAVDEHLQFFRTAGVFIAEKNQWRISVHGWVYEPQDSQFRKAVFVQALKTKYDLKIDAHNESYFDRRLNLLIADNERNKKIILRIAGQDTALPKTSPNGHFQTVIELDADLIDKHRHDDVLDYVAIAEDGRRFEGQVQLLDAAGLSVISDIDDTIKISEVLDHQSLINNTFLKAFTAVPGMSQAYQKLAVNNQGLSFHYVSSSPWNLYAPLEEFVDEQQFPRATFSLKVIRFRDSTLFDLFKPGTETKPLQIEALLEQFPQRRFILIGDSGEQDPEVYSAMAAKYPKRIAHIYIRNISGETISNQRMAPLLADTGLWTLFDDPKEIAFQQ